MVEFGRDRDYFDFNNMIEMPKYHLKIASGYKATMDRYGSKLLLCTEVAHKLLNFETVWEVMAKFLRESRPEEYKQRCFDHFVGQTVMTSYNKKTYRIDDIDWETTPADAFPTRKGDTLKFTQYYWDHYNIRIREEKQPMLVTMPKLSKQEKEMNKKNNVTPGPILLVPELCVLTG